MESIPGIKLLIPNSILTRLKNELKLNWNRVKYEAVWLFSQGKSEAERIVNKVSDQVHKQDERVIYE